MIKMKTSFIDSVNLENKEMDKMPNAKTKPSRDKKGDSETQIKEKENKPLSTNKRGSSKKGSKRKSDDDSLPDQTNTKRKPKGSIVAISERKQDSLQLTPQKKINAKETQNTHS